MAFDFHLNREKYFQLQYKNSLNFILPFIESQKPLKPQLRVLEIGCRDGGVLKPFLERGCHITGIDMDENPVQDARKRYNEAIIAESAAFFTSNILDFIEECKRFRPERFDIIILKDVIEHVHNRETFMAEVSFLLADKGIIFFGFPPWISPFGGHQQVLSNKFLSKIPYIHVLPDSIYYGLVKFLQPRALPFVQDIKSTRISINTFEQLCKQNNLRVVTKRLYLVAPMFKYKFGLNPVKQFKIITNIPLLRDLLTTTAEYIVAKGV